jgi:hypothetical protein
VVGEQATLGAQLLRGGEEAPQPRRVIQVRRCAAEALEHLRETGAAEPVLSGSQIHQHQLRVLQRRAPHRLRAEPWGPSLGQRR